MTIIFPVGPVISCRWKSSVAAFAPDAVNSDCSIALCASEAFEPAIAAETSATVPAAFKGSITTLEVRFTLAGFGGLGEACGAMIGFAGDLTSVGVGGGVTGGCV